MTDVKKTDLETTYMGLSLRNPLVPSASPLSKNTDYARQLEDAGAGAIVMYSLFEEDLRDEEERLVRFGLEQDLGHHEAEHFLPNHREVKTTLDIYLEQLTRLKSCLDIPVIASLNGSTMSHWLDHGEDLEEAGADALELNINYIPADITETAEDVESRYEAIVRELVNHVNIPVAIKLSPQFTALPHLIRRLEAAGAGAVVMFNRFYQPNINLEEMTVDYSLTLSDEADALLAMRWIALLYGRVNLSLAATGGIHSGKQALKMIAAGAAVTQACSTLLINGPNQLGVILNDMRRWLEEFEYESIRQLQGCISQQNAPDPSSYERANYTKTLNTFRLSTQHWI